MYARQYIQFLYTFNELGDYYQCHDLLEDVWLEEGREPFYQGLLQVAVALYHAENKNLAGACKLMQAALQKLAPYPAVWMGIQLDSLISFAELCLQRFLSGKLDPPNSFQITIVEPALRRSVEQIKFDQGGTLP